jgi:hypothetical protein
MADPDLRVLARFLPEFERANFSPGDWSEMQKQEDGVYTMPYATLSPAASEFVKAAYERRASDGVSPDGSRRRRAAG